ncbi:glyoxalase [Frankia sp. CcI49]|uniref:VOC family protein n=1 Tax=unclassified Frankia TaxID=2632575 RepID=UPI0006CA268C|nr:MULTISPECIES: VOC family protein [unclassified Frankia]KPM54750.1 glyoxalase [Frankia sp. R43]ONH61392.1 glyoxalase [Frankia sp. CcI49]
MAVARVEVGLVSADDALATFYATVFELEQLPVIKSETGVVHRLQAPGTAIKVMVPVQPPAAADPPSLFVGATGIQYLTLYVDDLDKILACVPDAGGHLLQGPLTFGPGIRVAVFRDPDGNAFEVVEGAS